MIVETQVEEMISSFDDLYEIKDQTRDIVRGAREQVKAKKKRNKKKKDPAA
mgnify:CR=1 FL=1